MAPSKSLLSKLKFKPTKQLQLDPEENPDAPEEIVFGTSHETVTLPPVTAKERKTWAGARASQRSDAFGRPVEGWAARISAMKSDGRLIQLAGLWYRRE